MLVGNKAIQVHQTNALIRDFWCNVSGKRKIDHAPHRRARQVVDTDGERPSARTRDQHIRCGESVIEI
jgi:hypothetical protein